MSLLHQQQQTPQMWPSVCSVQKTGPGTSAYINGQQNEEQMAQQAHRNIESRLKVARLFQQYRAQLISNPHDVTVTSVPASREEKICLTVCENKKIIPLTVKNCGARTIYFTLWASDFVKNIFTVRECHGKKITTIKEHTLGPGEAYKIKVHFYSDQAGFYEQLLVFRFETSPLSSDKFEIMRLLEVRSQAQALLPTKFNQTVTQMLTYARGNNAIPTNVKEKMKLRNMELENKPLNWENYCWRFCMLLNIEHEYQNANLKKYTQDDVLLFRHKDFTNIVVLQLAGASYTELVKNLALVTPLNQSIFSKCIIYKALVLHVTEGEIYLKFHRKDLEQITDGMRVKVSFIMDKMPLVMQRRAVKLLCKYKLMQVVFPTEQVSFRQSPLNSLTGLQNNPEQCTAIQHIVAGSAKPAPYLLFGPPGTGKTVTLVEAIRQIIKTQRSFNILACAPSNNATDHLCEKIVDSSPDEFMVYRLYALGFPVSNIPKNRKFFCNLDWRTNLLRVPSKREMMSCQIMVTTLLTAGRLVSARIPSDYYTYIFVDEAGQAKETECIIPIAGLLNPWKCQVVLAGDPKQLGPVVMSTQAVKHGMGMSLLERLMTDFDLYKSHEIYGFNNHFVTKLLRNYRSHPVLLKIPNELFYKGELQPYAHEININSYCKWERLPKKGFPLIFHGVAGTIEQDANSCSFYNIAEVEVLKEYLKSLIYSLHKKGVTKVQLGQIGIISPYKKQVEKIKLAIQMDKDLKRKNLENVLVGSVEQFQGKEFDVILVSVVRSNPKLSSQKGFTLGFVTNEKRFNVAITRARALLIVVGDPRVLKTSPIWNKLIHYCFKEGAYCGITICDAEEEEVLAPVDLHTLSEE